MDDSEATVPTEAQSRGGATASEAAGRGIFISYTQGDREWAEWIAWTLEDAGYSTYIQVWDCPSSTDFVSFMSRAIQQSRRTIAVLSDDYQTSQWTTAEWFPTFQADPDGQKRLLVPVRVRPYKPYGPLSQRVYVDLVGLTEEAAKSTLLGSFGPEDRTENGLTTLPDTQPRGKPDKAPPFPGAAIETEEETESRHVLRLVIPIGVLFAIGIFFLGISYYKGSESGIGEAKLAYWDKMFNGFGKDDALTRSENGIGGPGFLIEVFRMAFFLLIALVLMPCFTFRDATRRLIAGSRPLRAWFRIGEGEPVPGATRWDSLYGYAILLFFGTIICLKLVPHHLYNGPAELWEAIGYRDAALRTKALDEMKAKGSPEATAHDKAPTHDSPFYADYWKSCLLPYRYYFVYSFINFGIGLSVMLTISSFALGSDLVWMYRWESVFDAQFRRGAIPVDGLDAHFRKAFLERMYEVLDRYYGLLTYVMVGLAYVVWLDSVNVTNTAYGAEFQAAIVAAIPLLLLVLLSTVFYSNARGAVAKRTADADAFLERHLARDFYRRSLARSKYYLIGLLLLIAILVREAAAYVRLR